MDSTEAIRVLQAAGIGTPRLEARLLLAQALDVSAVSIVAGTHPPPTPEQTAEFARLIAERARRVPLAYLRGTQEFYALDFEVTPDTLIPRPETELLVEAVLNVAVRGGIETFLLADVGTGTGCIPISVAKYQGHVRAVAFDLSADALAVAQSNANRHGVAERVRFVRGDLLSGAAPETFDAVVSNPPYIAENEMAELQPEVRDFEPRLALAGGVDGLEVYRKLIPQAYRALKWNGLLYLEVGQGQAAAVRALLENAGFRWPWTREDFAGIERVVAAKKHPTL